MLPFFICLKFDLSKVICKIIIYTDGQILIEIYKKSDKKLARANIEYIQAF